MTLLSVGSSNLLNRQIQTPFELSRGQINLDATTQSFVSQVRDPYLMAGMLVGGLVGRGLRLAGVSSLGTLLGESRLAYHTARAGGFALGFAGEAAAFTGTGRVLRGESFQGFGSDWAHSMVSLGALRVAGVATAGQSQIIQRTVNSSAMVLANQVAGALNIVEAPHGNLTDQFTQALVMDLQSSMSRHLMDQFLPVVGRMEKVLDTRITMREWSSVSNSTQRSPVIERMSEAYLRLRAKAATFTLALGAANLLPRLANAQEHAERVAHATSLAGNIAWGVGGALPGMLAGFFYPILKGKYKAYVALPVALGAGLLAVRLGTDFSSLREAAGNIAFLGGALLAGLSHEVWLQRRINDHERIHFWQHVIPRSNYVRTRSVEGDVETYRRVMEEPPVVVNLDDASWSHAATSKGPSPTRDPDDHYPLEFVRFVHNASPKSDGFLNGNYLYNRIFHGTRITAFLEGLVSTIPLVGLYRRFNRVQGRSIRDFLVQKFNIAYPERFDWSALERDSGSFNDFFTRPLVTPPEGLEVMPGQTFHDGVLDVVARGNLLDTGIRLARKGPMVKEGAGSWRGDAILPLREILGRAATRFEGVPQTLIATYLSPRHWHQTLSPVSGTIRDIEVIEGKLHSVDPGIRHILSDPNFSGKPASYFQSENSRVVVTIDTLEYGPVAIVMTAAALVSTSRVFPRVGQNVELGELLHEYRWGSHNTLVMRSDKVALAPCLVPGRQVYVRGTKPQGEDGIEWLFVPRSALR